MQSYTEKKNQNAFEFPLRFLCVLCASAVVS